MIIVISISKGSSSLFSFALWSVEQVHLACAYFYFGQNDEYWWHVNVFVCVCERERLYSMCFRLSKHLTVRVAEVEQVVLHRQRQRLPSADVCTCVNNFRASSWWEFNQSVREIEGRLIGWAIGGNRAEEETLNKWRKQVKHKWKLIGKRRWQEKDWNRKVQGCGNRSWWGDTDFKVWFYVELSDSSSHSSLLEYNLLL